MHLGSHATDTTIKETPVFVNNTLHSLFHDCIITAKGKKFQLQTAITPTKPSLKRVFTQERSQRNLVKCQKTNMNQNQTFLYRCTKIIPKTFLVSSVVQSWDHENVFNREHIRKFVLAMTTNAGFQGAKQTNPLNY